jgi:hypothetical protein
MMIRNLPVAPLTLTELVTSVAGVVPLMRRELVERRLAHWSARGILQPTGPLHTGSGRSRLFDSQEAFIAAILLRLPVAIGSVKAIAQVIRAAPAKSEEAAKRWETAQNPTRGDRKTIFAAFSIALDADGERPAAMDFFLGEGDGLTTPRFYLQRESLLVVNLSDTFSRVRFL